MRRVTTLFLLFCLGLPSLATAQMATRCQVDDVLALSWQWTGRNAWARKCGYITVTKEAFLNAEFEYQVFFNGCAAYPNLPPNSVSCEVFVPYWESAPCVTNLLKLGTCITG
ncbi:hypothetical protein [Pyxidicoccus sp. MSG2]|uniref:hypothetical protein n=1 Tax=Pyxidicoccus sp. MSG2 TaxID=2996790 RepID=UPI00226E2127|nr:hypothetical protein [Pyxidicoccus sp. MSG2]MCY1022763.1 hypothetical protein [Pyxidicoccus sp. MSG2]